MPNLTSGPVAVRPVSFDLERRTFLSLRRQSQRSLGISHQGTPKPISLDSN